MKKIQKILFCSLSGFFFFSQTSFAIEYGGFGGRPSFPRIDNPRTESIFVHSVDVGNVVEEAVTVTNSSSDTPRVCFRFCPIY